MSFRNIQAISPGNYQITVEISFPWSPNEVFFKKTYNIVATSSIPSSISLTSQSDPNSCSKTVTASSNVPGTIFNWVIDHSYTANNQSSVTLYGLGNHYLDVTAQNNCGSYSQSFYEYISQCSSTIYYSTQPKVTGTSSKVTKEYHLSTDVTQEHKLPINITKEYLLTDNTLKEYQIYPNPSSDVLNVNTIDVDNQEIRIFNILGQTLISKNLEKNSLNQIDINSLETGIYLAVIYQNNKIVHEEKIVKN
jgi:Secretion system C-terminal sorting domain